MHIYNTYTNVSKEELIRIARKQQNKLIKRRERLEDAISKRPGEYDTQGLKILRNKIPSISKDQHRNYIVAGINYMEQLENMKTTSARGAKKVLKDRIKAMLNLPTTTKLTAKENRKFKEGLQYFKDYPDQITVFWEGFGEYKRKSLYRNLDSKQLVEEYSPVFQDSLSTYDNLNAMFDKIKEVADNYYDVETNLSDFDFKWGSDDDY